jgi:hypothetical protein
MFLDGILSRFYYLEAFNATPILEKLLEIKL